MKIQTIEITNYKAFRGTHKIDVGGQNLFIYGENGSGKSSLYYALKDFFQSSREDIDLAQLENVFVEQRKRGTVAIKVAFNLDDKGRNKKKSYVFNTTKNDTRDGNDASIRDGNLLKSFLTYKHLLTIHHLKKDDEINLFDLLVKGVLNHFKYSLTNGKELGELWDDVEEIINRDTGKEYPISKKKMDANAAIETFNEAFGELFNVESPEYILKHAKPLLDYFNINLSIYLRYAQVRPIDDYQHLEGNKVRVELDYAGKRIDKPHLFLNEARLSAIAISIYLGMIKRHVQGIPCKILFLDDIFIGLDISNRLPLLAILENEFHDYQIFITTYDKPWFEHAKFVLNQKSTINENFKWKTLEFYAKTTKDDIEIPLIKDTNSLINTAKLHLVEKDYKAAAVYARSAFEKLIQNYCEKMKLSVTYKSRIKDYDTEDFWKVIKNKLPQEIQNSVERSRSLVLNPFSHYNTDIHEIKTELSQGIETIKKLEDELVKQCKMQTLSSKLDQSV